MNAHPGEDTPVIKMWWDEPPGATSPRGWLWREEHPVGFYLDYGPGHYRSPHSDTIGGREVVWCKPDDKCPSCEPGNVLAVRYPGGPGQSEEARREWRWTETVTEARKFIEQPWNATALPACAGTGTPARTLLVVAPLEAPEAE